MTARCPELHEASVQALISIDGLPHNSVFLWTRRRRPLAHRNVRTAIRRFAADDRSASARTPIACTGAVLLAARCGARLRHRGRSHRRRRRRAPRTAHVSSLQASGSRRWPLVGSGATTRSPNSPGTALSGCRVRFAAPGLPECFAHSGRFQFAAAAPITVVSTGRGNWFHSGFSLGATRTVRVLVLSRRVSPTHRALMLRPMTCPRAGHARQPSDRDRPRVFQHIEALCQVTAIACRGRGKPSLIQTRACRCDYGK
jgi:hypothetical protein